MFLLVVTVQGKTLQIPASQGLAAIDTGTTLIGAPSSIVAQFYSAVPGSKALTGQYDGMYAFREYLIFPSSPPNQRLADV